ncbi:hypothetical protein [Sphingobacterium deserti]|uniref:Uncharacterized protein n=1 Tax=Sphingobacterium deserti TaxID=1229276 RepID=A0A0B8SZ98_9SPHI|nr:hypothetical protein [Sphingobacterium deserti]KGE12721.1 hypothetical protein DI53_3460 [Sphingobacterium deserti]
MFTSSEIHIINILRNGVGYRNLPTSAHYSDSDIKNAIRQLMQKGIIKKAKANVLNWPIENHMLTDYGEMYPL